MLFSQQVGLEDLSWTTFSSPGQLHEWRSKLEPVDFTSNKSKREWTVNGP